MASAPAAHGSQGRRSRAQRRPGQREEAWFAFSNSAWILQYRLLYMLYYVINAMLEHGHYAAYYKLYYILRVLHYNICYITYILL